jgi:hypothetical protein
MFVIQNITLFPANSNSHTIVTRQIQNLHFPQANLTIYQNGVYYAGIKVFNNLPIEIKNISSNLCKFKSVLKQFLITHSFYTVDEYLMRYICYFSVIFVCFLINCFVVYIVVH